jgi:opacity protein-like surface antigen
MTRTPRLLGNYVPGRDIVFQFGVIGLLMEKNRFSKATGFSADNVCAKNPVPTNIEVANVALNGPAVRTSHRIRLVVLLIQASVVSLTLLMTLIVASSAHAQSGGYSYYQAAQRNVQSPQQQYANRAQQPQYRTASAAQSPFPRTDQRGIPVNSATAGNLRAQYNGRQYNNQAAPQNNAGSLPPIYSVARRPAAPVSGSPMPGFPAASYGQDNVAPPMPEGYREARTRDNPVNPFVARKLPRTRRPYTSPVSVGAGTVRSLQQNQDDPFGELGNESPFAPAPNSSQDRTDNPFGEPAQENPFGEPSQDNKQIQNGDPFGELNQTPDPPQPDVNQAIPGLDPAPNTPPMDTQTIPPRLPGDGAYTPDPNQIPTLPIPGDPDSGQPRETEYPNGAVLPGEDDKEPEPDSRTREPSGPSPTPADPNNRGVGGTREKPSVSGGPRYLPAPDPTYYSAPVDPRGVPGGYMGSKQQIEAIAAMGNAGGYMNKALPGPYGYTGMMNPYAAMAKGYQNPALANVNPSGSCSTGCVAVNTCQAYTEAMLQMAAPRAAVAPQQAPVYVPSMQLPVPPATTYVGQQQQGVCPPTPAPQVASNCCPQPASACADPCSGNVYCSAIDDGCATCYLSLFGGSTALTNLIAREDRDIGTYFDESGLGFGGSLGQIQGRNLRLELEVSYRSQDVNGLRLLDGDGTTENLNLSGNFNTLAGMANAFWEFVDFPNRRVKPYIGAGVGFVTAFPDFTIDGVAVNTDDHESSLAYQWIVGANYKLERQTDLFLEYRYFRADSLNLNTDITPATTTGNGSGNIDHVADNIFFGVRMRF